MKDKVVEILLDIEYAMDNISTITYPSQFIYLGD